MRRGTFHSYQLTPRGRTYLESLQKLYEDRYFTKIDTEHPDAHKVYDWAVLTGIDEGFFDRPEYLSGGYTVPAESNPRLKPSFRRLFEHGYIERMD